MTFNMDDYAVSTAKPLPVILLLDVSGSMQGEKIHNLNESVKDMLETFRDTEHGEREIHVAVFTFGAGEVKLHQPLADVATIQWQDLTANGSTPLGITLRAAKAMCEDKSIMPQRKYLPYVILVSDGIPTDDWEQPLQDFIDTKPTSKYHRYSLAIGNDANEQVLGKFSPYPLFYAEDARRIRDFFKFVTMSITMGLQSQDPNIVPEAELIGFRPPTIEEKKEKSEQSSVSGQSGDSQTRERSYNKGFC